MRVAINFINICMDYILYLCGRDKIGEEVGVVLSEVTILVFQFKDDSFVNVVLNLGGYMLFIFGKRLYIIVLNEYKKFRDMGNKQGAVEIIIVLEKDGFGLIISNRIQGIVKVCDL